MRATPPWQLGITHGISRDTVLRWRLFRHDKLIQRIEIDFTGWELHDHLVCVAVINIINIINIVRTL